MPANHDDSSNAPSDAPERAAVASTNAEDTRSRRDFLKKATICTCSLGVAGATAAPGLALLGYPLSHATTTGGRGFLPAGKPTRFVAGVPTKVELFDDTTDAWNRVEQVKVGSAWVLRRSNGLVALSTVCPHVGCGIEYDEQHDKFYCPCHRSYFGLDGAREEGPSPRDLDELEVQEKDGIIEVRYARFRQGTADKVEI
ncbi:MAG: Rieske (2Fe-2S) protein [Myxococcales bacterium FL481]|nr:MAG: Rieske (2Fe-2S) protein [Myxococcales bacterium FL481]